MLMMQKLSFKLHTNIISTLNKVLYCMFIISEYFLIKFKLFSQEGYLYLEGGME